MDRHGALVVTGQRSEIVAPIPMRLPCPSCGALHLDVGEFATKVHHTHACQECGMVWRPAVVPTVGVRFLPGFRNDLAAPTPEGIAELRLEARMERCRSIIRDLTPDTDERGLVLALDRIGDVLGMAHGAATTALSGSSGGAS